MTQEEREHLQHVRNNIPEPTHVEHHIVRFKWPDKTDWSASFADPDGADWSKLQASCGELRRQRFVEGRMIYWAWTFDGITPLFPGYEPENND